MLHREGGEAEHCEPGVFFTGGGDDEQQPRCVQFLVREKRSAVRGQVEFISAGSTKK